MSQKAAGDRASLSESLRSEAADKTPAPPAALYIRCPQCLNRSPVANDARLADVACPSCGSRLDLVDDSTSNRTAAENPAAPGRTIGHFQLLDPLGEGGFGSVWKACDSQLDRIVAVKLPHRGKLGRDETEKFLREARAAAQLRHPGIVSVHEVGLEGDLLYIVSDFVEGQSLDKWLADQRPAYRESARLCAKIAEALEHAHQAGVVHRDLKPSNIMIDAAGEPHLMDFGLAKRTAGETTMTVEGQVLGTPAYMSPEQARGQAHAADARSDVYALGVILFELLTGERPFRGNLQMLLKQVIEDEPPSPRKLDGRIPRDLEIICLKCVQKEPSRRYSTARAVADELNRFLAHVPIEARPVGRLERAWRWCRRKPLVAGSAAVAIMALLFGLVTASIGYLRASWALENSRQSLREARQVVNDFCTEVSDKDLFNQPGMQPLRAKLLGRARDYYQHFLDENQHLEELRDDLAAAHYRVGLITEEIESPGAAIRSYQLARELQEKLSTAAPEDTDRLKALGDTLNAIGRCLHRLAHDDALQDPLSQAAHGDAEQRPAPAAEAYAAAIGVRSRLAGLAPEVRDFRRTLANTYMNMGLVEKECGRLEQARQYMEQAQAIRQELRAGGGDEPEIRRDQAMGCFNLATLAAQAGDCASAQRSIGSASELFAALASGKNNNLAASYQLAVCYRMEGDLRCAPTDDQELLEQRRSAAIESYCKALQVLRPLAENNPSVPEYRAALAEVQLNIGQAEYERGPQRRDAAVAAFEQAGELLTALVQDHAENVRYRRDFYAAMGALGHLYDEAGRGSESLSTLETLRSQLQGFLKQFPDAADVREQLEKNAAAIEKLHSGTQIR